MRKTFDIQGRPDALEVVSELGQLMSLANLKECFVRVTLEVVKYEEDKDALAERSKKKISRLRIAE